jgi:hypothetical protein
VQFRVPDDDEVYDFVTSKFTFGEAKALEKVTGLTMGAISEASAESQSVVVLQAMFWISMKRKRPTLAFVELEDVPIDDIEFIAEDDDEQASLDDHDGATVGPTSPAPEDDAGPHLATA